MTMSSRQPSHGQGEPAPRTEADHRRAAPEDLLLRTNRSLDELFRRSPAGDVPRGRSVGTAVFFPGTGAAPALARVVRALAWKGKVFDPQRNELANLLGPFGFPAVRAAVYTGESLVDGQNCVVLDYSRTSLLARWVRDEIRLVAPGTYLGVAWLRRRRVAWFVLRFPVG